MDRKKISSEMLVGILVLIGIILLFYMSFRIGKFGTFGQQGYEITLSLNNANGLDPRSPVHIAGVDVGKIKTIKLDGYKALVTLLIKNGIKIPVDSKAAVKTQGTLGDRYIEIIPGTAQIYLAAGDRINDIVIVADLDEVFSRVSVAAKNFGETINDFKGIIGEAEKINVKKSLENIQTVSGDFKELIANNKDNVGRIVNNLETISKDIENGKGTIGKLVKDETLYNDARDVVASLKSVSNDIEQGKGTLGKLAKDESLYTDVKKAVDNITDITDGIKKGEGTFGKLAKDESLYHETEKAMKKVQKAAEGIQELTPITILGTLFGTFF
jgi:phospholipid/cholesterol/gamma-HCH transport system substrate-binding protein